MRSNRSSLFSELGENRNSYLFGVTLAALASTLSGAIAFGMASLLAPILAQDEPDWRFLWAVVTLVAMRALFTHLGDRMVLNTVGAIKLRLRSSLAHAVLRCGPFSSETKEIHQFRSLITITVDNIEPYFTQILPTMVTSAITIILIGTALAVVDPISASILFVVLLATPVVTFLIGQNARKHAETQWGTLVRLGETLFDTIRGISSVRALRQEKLFAERISRSHNEFHARTLVALRTAFLSNFALDLGSSLGIALVAVAASLRLMEGQMAFFNAILVLLLTPELFNPLRAVGTLFHAGNSARAAYASIEKARQELQEKPGAPIINAALASGERNNSSISREQNWNLLTLNDVTFLHRSRNGEAGLSNISLKIRRGEKIALLGENGSGKTTLLHLLAGAIAPQSGTMLLDGLSFSPEVWIKFASCVAFIPQISPLLPTSLEQNITMDSDRFSLQSLSLATTRAGLSPVLDRLPHRLQTPIGEELWNPSAGEAQRILLARALLRNSSLILMDEATAHLSPKEADLLHETLRSLPADITICIATHRKSTLQLCDRVVQLQNGCCYED